MKAAFILLLLIPLAFAAWQNIAALAIGLSLALLTIAFVIGMGFDINELKMIAKEEFFQLLGLALMMIILTETDGLLNSISSSPAFTDDTAPTLQDAAVNIIDDTLDDTVALLNKIGEFDRAVSREGSKGSNCNMLGIGYSVSGCGGFSMLSTPLSMSGGITGFAIAELSAMKKLIVIAQNYAMTLILPLGIVLRTFKVTRGGGGFLIALAIALYIVVPGGVVFNEMLAETFLANATASADYGGTPSGSIGSCDPGDTGGIEILLIGAGWESENANEQTVVSGYNSLRADIRKYLYMILIRATLGPVIALLMMAASIRALTSLAGAEVDVSAISRFV